jgi:hypothetical protein
MRVRKRWKEDRRMGNFILVVIINIIMWGVCYLGITMGADITFIILNTFFWTFILTSSIIKQDKVRKE